MDTCIRHQAHRTAIADDGRLISAVAVAVFGGDELLGNIFLPKQSCLGIQHKD